MIRTFAFAAVFAFSTNVYAQETSSIPLGDEVFLMKPYCEGMAEVAKCKLACEKTTQPAIKAFAGQMVKDHSECNNKIAEVARQKAFRSQARRARFIRSP
jgi:predicted outer membrane protein